MTAIYKQINMDILDACISRLSTAMQKFTVCISINGVLVLGD